MHFLIQKVMICGCNIIPCDVPKKQSFRLYFTSLVPADTDLEVRCIYAQRAELFALGKCKDEECI